MTVRLHRRTATAVALGLLAASVLLLYVGRFIQFDDTSGFGSNDWVMPLGLLGGIGAIASVAVGSRSSSGWSRSSV